MEAFVLDQEEKNFYTLIFNNTNYNTHLNLARFNIEKSKIFVFQDSIPYEFLDTESWGTILLNNEKNELTAVKSSKQLIPPLTEKEVLQKDPIKIATAVFLIILGCFFIYFKSKNRKSTFIVKPNDQEIYHYPDYGHTEQRTVSAIYILGGLQVFDKQGEEITTSFTPTLKLLFLLVFLYTIRNENGTSSAKLRYLFWYDKSEDSARNNRNINISKLRILLEKIAEIEVNNENTYWKMHIQNMYILTTLKLYISVKL